MGVEDRYGVGRASSAAGPPGSSGGAMLTPDEVAEWLRVPVRTVQRLYRSGNLRVVKVGRSVRIPSANVQAYIDGVPERGGEPDADR